MARPRLAPRGWELDGHPPLLIRPPGQPLPPAHEELEIHEVADRATLVDFKQVIVNGFPFEELQPFEPDARLDERILDASDNHLFVGYIDQAPVVSGWLLLHAGLGVLVLAASIPEARRRGYWTAMLRRRIQVAATRPVAAIFGDMSRPGAERYGFLPVLRFTFWHHDRKH